MKGIVLYFLKACERVFENLSSANIILKTIFFRFKIGLIHNFSFKILQSNFLGVYETAT